MWDCTFKAFDGPPGASGHATIQVDGDNLDWTLDAFDMPDLKRNTAPVAFHYRVLENNRIGLVAVSAQAQMDKDVGPLISSETIVLNKADGKLSAGGVGTNGAHDSLSGTCRLK
jgi:hypothetical protein